MATRGLFYLDLSCGDRGAFQPWSWRKVTKGLFNLGIGVMMTKGLFNFDLSCDDQRAFQPWSWRKGNQGVFQPWNRSYDDQGAFQPRSWRNVTKGLFNLGTRAMTTKGLFNLDLSCGDHRAFQPQSELWRPRGFSTLILMKGNQEAF